MTVPRAPWSLVVVPLLFAALSLPMALELVEPNGFYGVRTAAARASEGEWYRINRVGGAVGVIAGVAGFAANLAIMRSSIAVPRKPLVCLAVVVSAGLSIVLASLAAA